MFVSDMKTNRDLQIKYVRILPAPDTKRNKQNKNKMKKRLLNTALFILLGIIAASCSRKYETADIVYVNAVVITVDSLNTIAEAVAVKDGKILAVGSNKEVNNYKGDSTEVVDLQGKFLLPGFIDPHSHFMAAFAAELSTDISSPPIGSVNNIKDIVAKLKQFKTDNQLGDSALLIGMGFDPDQLAEQTYPTINDLDPEFPANPVVLLHASGHIGVVNSAALKLAGITEKTPDPFGGQIQRIAGTKKPNGVLFENAWFNNQDKFMIPSLTKLKEHIQENNKESAKDEIKKNTLPDDIVKKLAKLFDKAQQLYASSGYTTAQEGLSNAGTIKLLKYAQKEKLFYIDILSLISDDQIEELAGNPEFVFGVNTGHLKFIGAKFICDGSPQGKTAYLSKPLMPESGCTDECSGKPNIDQNTLNKLVTKCYQNGIQVFAHCNGDAAIDMILTAHEYAIKTLNIPDTKISRGTVIVHSQIIRKDQLEKYKQYGITPSFFTNHTFYWGDVHIRNLGKERAFFLSPFNTAMKLGLKPTNHTDFNVTPLNGIFTIWTAVNRVSRTGVILGEDEKISPLEAIKAITIYSAIAIGEQKYKGTIEKGKFADFVILSGNPLTIDPLKIKDIKILKTIKEGRVVYAN